MRRTLGMALGAIAVIAGCGGGSTAGDDAGSNLDGGPRDGGSIDTGSADAGPIDGGSVDAESVDAGVGPCPATLPEAGAACGREGLTCQYGLRTCISIAECSGGTWSVAAPRCAPPPSDCPVTREAAQGNACATEGGRCLYEDGLICTCTSCPDPYPLCAPVDPPVWACEAPNPDPQCPVAQPLLGTACAVEGQICDYGCESDTRRVCSGGGWVADSPPGGCPRSTRRAKRDIEYLDEQEIDRLAEDVVRTRLASYQYVDPALAGRRHLGFIIEDQPQGAYAVDPERSQVDLYGYTSMLLATVQAQQRRIESLEREVAAMRRRR